MCRFPLNVDIKNYTVKVWSSNFSQPCSIHKLALIDLCELICCILHQYCQEFIIYIMNS